MDDLLEKYLASEQDLQDTSVENIQDYETLDVDVQDDRFVDFCISEKEASDLAIVHDESLANPLNKENSNFNTREDSNSDATVPSQVISLSEHVIQDNPEQQQAVQINLSPERPRILIVDDSPSVRKQLELELDLYEVNVDFAECAERAFEFVIQKYLEENGEKNDSWELNNLKKADEKFKNWIKCKV